MLFSTALNRVAWERPQSKFREEPEHSSQIAIAINNKEKLDSKEKLEKQGFTKLEIVAWEGWETFPRKINMT